MDVLKERRGLYLLYRANSKARSCGCGSLVDEARSKEDKGRCGRKAFGKGEYQILVMR